MKKLSFKNLELDANDVLQRAQLKNVFGGYNLGSCTASLNCATGAISCTSPTGDCKRGFGVIYCDGKPYEC